ncbi:MAG: hypothetical protein RJA09_253, partial [Pseudomonadota bacterium]
MTSSIEKAAQRLEQLRQAGVDIPAAASPAPVSVAPAVPTPAPAVAMAAPASPQPAEPAAQSRSIHIDLASLSARGFVTPHA